ncbi:hypothetical protein KR018_002349 [Drosophila ironensis]|nr:hypothetical protein KR018_002349 [Drosophila ironensis]
MAAGFRPYAQDPNLTNSAAPATCMSVVRYPEPHPYLQLQLHPLACANFNLLNLHPLTAVQPSFPHPYQQYLSQFAPTFVPYYHRLLTRPIVKQEEMDIENYNIKHQQRLMRQRSLKPLGQLQPIMQPPAERVPLKLALPPRRIIKAELVAIATPSGGIKELKPAVKPLPPITETVKQQVAKIQKSQHHYEQLFGRLTSMLRTLNQRYGDNEDVEEEVPAPPLKRPRHISTSSAESHLPESTESGSSSNLEGNKYPQRVQREDGSVCYVLGPNGTQITANQYAEVFWTNAPVATRCLLCVVFTSDELATHTLTGKPSPAFYGRERPPKLQLDQCKVDDIVLSVKSRTGGKERVIRATITTKCADTAKKYKRRAKKAQKAN